MAWVSGALAVGSLAASFLGNRAAGDAQEDAAREAAQAYNIPFYGDGERIVKKAAKFLASKYNGTPVEAMPTFRALAGGPMGDAVRSVSGRAVTPLAAPSFQGSRAAFDVGGKKFNADLGRRYGDLTADALVAQQGAKVGFHDWQNRGYLGALQSAPGPTNGADLLVPTAYSLGRIGYQWAADRDEDAANLASAQSAQLAERGGDYAITPWRVSP